MAIDRIPILGAFHRNGQTVRLAVPVFLELILSVAMGYVNQFMLAGVPIASNAVAQANQIANIFVVSFSVLATASLILITQLTGAKETKMANRIYPLSFWFNLTMGLLVAVIVMGLSPTAFGWMGVSPTVKDSAIAYQIITGPSLVFLALTQVFSSFLRANKKMVQPTVIAFGVNVVNALGTAAAVFWIPGLSDTQKLYGVAISMDAARLIALLLCVFFYVRHIGIGLGVKALRPFPFSLFKRLLSIGLPTSGETLSYNFSQLVLSVVVNYSVPVLEQNLRNYLMTLTSIIYLFANGTAIAMQVIEGNLIGAKKKEEAYRLVKDTGTMARTVSFLMSLLILGISYPVFVGLMGNAVKDPNVNVDNVTLADCGWMAFQCMIIDVFLDQGRATNLVYVKGLETAGDITFPVLASIVTSWTFTVGLSALLCFVFRLGIYGAFLGACFDECVRGIAFVIRWKKGRWRHIELTADIKETNKP